MADKLTSRINAGIATVQQWEADEQLLQECRAQIPFHLLCPDQFYHLYQEERICDDSPYAKEDDMNYQGDDLLLKRLTLYFKQIMMWVNNPPCELCGSCDTKCRHVRGAIRPDEKEGQASRVEVYWCPNCNAETTLFPRYNHPRKLLETKKGRCGEYANLFGLFCRAAGFETRYISDFTDHVWTEVYSNRLGRWIMCDSCEGVIDAPSMYEKGWGKNLNYILAFTTDSVVDVTRRYTRKIKTGEFQARRNSVCPGGDSLSEMIIAQFNTELRNSQRLSPKHLEELDRRIAHEKRFLEHAEIMTSWDTTDYSEGRQSGSLSWRISRGETGRKLDGINSSNIQQKHSRTATTAVITLNTEDLREVAKLHLRNEDNVVPSNILMRLPDSSMPLASQVAASFQVKKAAFMSYIQSQNTTTKNSKSVIGFCTKQALPIYLIDQSCYPFVKIANSSISNLDSWKTFHFVPDSLMKEENANDCDSFDFDLPVNEEFFTELLGTRLLQHDNEKVSSIETITALSKCRLVAFYFSAHWCSPCKRFTPMLTEMYIQLKKSFPTYGLEIVFVSSDRNSIEFQQYFNEMPWLAVPYDNSSVHSFISQRFSVQGIPAIVVLDVISGNVVVAPEICRNEISHACQYGDGAIENLFMEWLEQIPRDSKELFDTLMLSCNNVTSEANDAIMDDENDERTKENSGEVMSKEEQSDRIKQIFSELVENGTAPNDAALSAIQQVTKEIEEKKSKQTMENLNDKRNAKQLLSVAPENVNPELLSLLLKYINNIEKHPSQSKFRMMKFSNKVFDMVTSTLNGSELLNYLGFHIFPTDIDFIATVPLASDVSLIKQRITEMLEDDNMDINA
mmetsp:Transcript_760/g.1304  ORF Transcript_760/g.1304 Transcript_760/m.1304 type:complete len:849 (-) Transcript_760:1998-4544(-)